METKTRPHLERLSWIAGIISALIALLALVYSLIPSKPERVQPQISQSAGNVANQIGTVGGNVTIVNPTATPTPPISRKLPLIFKEGLIGSEARWFETIAGPPVRRHKDGELEYSVDECSLFVRHGRAGTVEAATLLLSDQCTFDWKAFGPNYASLPPPDRMTLGDAMKANPLWTFYSSCLSGCGNMEAGYSEVRFGGSHAHGWIVAAVGAAHNVYNSTYSVRLGKKIAGERGQDFVIDFGYKCNYDLNAAVKNVVEPMRVTHVSMRIRNDDQEPDIGDNAKCK